MECGTDAMKIDAVTDPRHGARVDIRGIAQGVPEAPDLVFAHDPETVEFPLTIVHRNGDARCDVEYLVVPRAYDVHQLRLGRERIGKVTGGRHVIVKAPLRTEHHLILQSGGNFDAIRGRKSGPRFTVPGWSPKTDA